MSISKSIFFITILLCVMSCGQNSDKTEGWDGQRDVKGKDVRRTYFDNGVLHREILYKDGVKDGVCKEFFKNGQIFEEVPYKNNKREGLAKRYYETGGLAQETPYENDKINGIRKRYRQSGDLMYEAPFYNGKECVGLKEYAIDNKLKVHYPTIVITPIDNILINGNYRLRINLSDKSTAVDYYLGPLVDGKYIDESGYLPKEKGVATISYQLATGEFKMEELTIVAKIKTAQSNYYITTAKFHLAIENRF